MKIPGILELTSRTKYGMTSRNVPLYLFRPLNQKLTPCIVGCSKKCATNVLAIVDVDKYEPTILPRGFLDRIIGNCGDFAAEEEALTCQYRKPSWAKDIRICVPIPATDRHFVEGISFNVDPAGCQDIDDVFTIGNDGYYYITIADVSEWTKVNPESLTKAIELGQTLYSITGRVLQSMIPFEAECSLLPGKERLGVSLRFKIVDSQITDTQFLKTRIINNLSYSYESIHESEYAGTLRNVAGCLGSDSPDSHDWIAQLMVFYNIESAKILRSRGKGVLRTHAPPDIEKLEKFKKLGVDEKFLAYKSAKYVSAKCTDFHWGLNTDVYCHATSPIRRVVDIVNQYVLKNEDPPEIDIDLLNVQMKETKQYARDLFFLKQLNTNIRSVSGVVLNDHRIWVPEWRRIITCKNTEADGTSGTLYFSLDMNQSSWKRRMVFKFVNTESRE